MLEIRNSAGYPDSPVHPFQDSPDSCQALESPAPNSAAPQLHRVAASEPQPPLRGLRRVGSDPSDDESSEISVPIWKQYHQGGDHEGKKRLQLQPPGVLREWNIHWNAQQ
jgi:hypothetical protein